MLTDPEEWGAIVRAVTPILSTCTVVMPSLADVLAVEAEPR